MADSYYYFFSAASQVLASILALFGVFMLFKIQAITNELLDIGHKIENFIAELHTNNSTPENAEIQTAKFLLKEALEKEAFSIINLRNIMKLDTKQVLKKNCSEYSILKEKFERLFEIYQNITTKSIDTSILASALIIICLGFLPFGKFLENKTIIIYIMIVITLLSAVVLWFLLSILINAFDVKISAWIYFKKVVTIIFYPFIQTFLFFKGKYEFWQFMRAEAKSAKKK